MVIYVDIDNTIFNTNGRDYENSTPIVENIEKINQLYDNGHTIIYWTARGRKSGKNYFMLTLSQLVDNKCKFHSLDTTSKPSYDYIIDDKAIKFDEISKI